MEEKKAERRKERKRVKKKANMIQTEKKGAEEIPGNISSPDPQQKLSAEMT